MRREALVVTVGLMLLAGAAPVRSAEPVNLVANGDFAKAPGGVPEHWQTAGDANVTQRLEVAADDDGRPFARLVCTRYDARGPSSHAMLAQVGRVRLVKGRMYEFSCRLRASGLQSRAVTVAVSNTESWTNCGLRASLPAGKRWRTHRQYFTATETVGPASRLQIWFNETGTLEVADVRIVEQRMQDVAFTDVVPPAGGRNLVRNGSFEVGPAGWSSLGTPTGWGNLAHLHGTIETDGAQHGRRFLRIPLGGDHTPVLYFDYYEPVERRELRPLAASLGWIEVEKGRPYTLSAWMRAGRDGVRAHLGVRARQPAGGQADQTQAVTLAKDWKRYTFTFRPAHPYVFVLVGPDLEKEERVDVDVDAVQLEKGEQATAFAPRRDVEVALAPTQPGGMFVEGDAAALRLSVCNHGATPQQVTIAVNVTDYFDQPVPWRGETVEAPARTVVERNLQLPPDWRGYYRVRATATVGEAVEAADLPLAVVPKQTADDTVLGINHAFADAYLVRVASKAGVTWYRDWTLKWQHIEPERGRFDWPRGDAQIDRVRRLGPNVLCLLPPFPSADWISEAPAGLPTTGYPGTRLRSAWAPKDPGELARYVGQAVARYKDRVRVWQFLNEPIYTDYSLPGPSGRKYGGKTYTPADYVRLLGPVAAAMRQADPGCKVIGGIGSGALNLTREVIDAGLLRHVDLMDLHFYPGARLPEGFLDEMDQLLAMMDAAGGRKPLWVTEFSYYGADRLPRRPFMPVGGSWAENRLLESERQCADRTVRFFLVMLARGVQKVFVHSGAGGEANRPNFECALLAEGGAPRKLAPALAVLADLLGPAPQVVGDRRLGEDGYAVCFRTDRGAVVALWTTDPETETRVAFPPMPGVERRDLMGRTIALEPLRLSVSPTYLVGPAGRARQMFDSVRAARPEPAAAR